MLAKLYSIRPEAWRLLAAMAVLSVGSAIFSSTRLIPPKTFSYFVQPAMALGVYGLAWYLARGQQDRVRHRSEKAFLVGSVLAVWFVLYFLSGLITTYVHNSLLPSLKALLINFWVFGVVAYAIEYARRGLLLLASRRNVVWFGAVVAAILSIQQMNFGLIPETHGLDGFVKLAISNFIPAIISSFLLSYLAITGGLPAMLVYRLGLVAIVILPPIIPKYDWYLQGVSLILLAVAIYMALDRTRQDRQASVAHHYHRHPHIAYETMSIISMVALAAFMTGFFTYRPAAIASNSMKPVFSRGSIVIVQKDTDPSQVRVGDIIQYARRSETITHRVISIDPAVDGSGQRVFTTKGDNNPSKDPPVAQSQLLGIVRAEVPYIGYPTAWLKQAAGSGIVK